MREHLLMRKQGQETKGAFMSTKMKAAQISKPGGDWELLERDIPEPNAGQVRVKVEALIGNSNFHA